MLISAGEQGSTNISHIIPSLLSVAAELLQTELVPGINTNITIQRGNE